MLFNMAIYYLFQFIYNTNKASKGSISGDDFNLMDFNQRKEVLKLAFEKDLYNWHGEIKRNVDYYEGVFKDTLDYARKSSFSDEELEKFRRDLVAYRELFKITLSVKNAVDIKNKVPGAPKTLFKCFLHDDSTPSMVYAAETHGFHCFGCCKNGEVYDIFNVIGLIYAYQNPDKAKLSFAQQFKFAVQMYVDQTYCPISHLFYTEQKESYHPKFIEYTTAMNKARYNKYLQLVGIKNDKVGTEYLKSRGISADTAHRLAVMVFYPKDDNGVAWGRAYLTLINSDGTYVRRLIGITDEQRSADCPFPANKWWNKKGTPLGIFNGQVIDHCEKCGEVCFVCESAIDAMSIEEMNTDEMIKNGLCFHAIALNGTENTQKFLREHSPQTVVKFICLSDNDDAGREMARLFAEKGFFTATSIEDYSKLAISQYKDVNDCLVQDRANLYQSLCEIEHRAKQFYNL